MSVSQYVRVCVSVSAQVKNTSAKHAQHQNKHAFWQKVIEVPPKYNILFPQFN